MSAFGATTLASVVCMEGGSVVAAGDNPGDNGNLSDGRRCPNNNKEALVVRSMAVSRDFPMGGSYPVELSTTGPPDGNAQAWYISRA